MENFEHFFTSNNRKLVHSSLVSEKKIMDETVLLHCSTGNYYSLNPTGTAIWNYCSESKRWDEILDFVRQQFQIEKIILEEDISSYIKELIREGIFEVR